MPGVEEQGRGEKATKAAYLMVKVSDIITYLMVKVSDIITYLMVKVSGVIIIYFSHGCHDHQQRWWLLPTWWYFGYQRHDNGQIQWSWGFWLQMPLAPLASDICIMIGKADSLVEAIFAVIILPQSAGCNFIMKCLKSW